MTYITLVIKIPVDKILMLAKHVLSYQREVRNGEERYDIIGLLVGSGSPAVLCAATMPVWFFTLMRLYGCRGYYEERFSRQKWEMARSERCMQDIIHYI
jgi:hypothetical protein